MRYVKKEINCFIKKYIPSDIKFVRRFLYKEDILNFKNNTETRFQEQLSQAMVESRSFGEPKFIRNVDIMDDKETLQFAALHIVPVSKNFTINIFQTCLKQKLKVQRYAEYIKD